jgi:DNA-binding CsgD family transcriptional regulator
MTGTRSKTPKTAAVTEVDAAHLQYLVRAIIAATEASAVSLQRDEGRANEHVVVDTDLDGVRYLLIRMPTVEPMRAMLSPREFEIVRMVAQGYQNKIIAGILNISTWTVCAHVRRVFAKFGVSSRAAMVARLLEADIGLQSSLGTVTPAAAPLRKPAPSNAVASRPAKPEINSAHAMSATEDDLAGIAPRGMARGRGEANQRRMLVTSR